MEIDALLARLHVTPLPDQLGALDGAALAAVARARVSETRKSSAVAAVAALILGVSASALPAKPVEASTALPLGALTPFAPSALLAN
ncbi:MAG: hypothetical protein ABI612_01530 [Betaproteobacteria bacterium]|jgi:hypothetical protein